MRPYSLKQIFFFNFLFKNTKGFIKQFPSHINPFTWLRPLVKWEFIKPGWGRYRGLLTSICPFPLCLIEQLVAPHFRLWLRATALLILPRPANISCPYSTAVLQSRTFAMIFPSMTVWDLWCIHNPDLPYHLH